MEVESSSDETITQNYINREIAYTDLFNERVKHSFDQAQNEQLDVVKKEYKDFKNAVQYYISKNAIDSKSINLFLEKQHELIAKVNTKIDSLREKIMLNQQNLEQYYKKNHSFLFFLKNKMYFIFNFFGYKTAEQISHEKYINEIKKSIASDKRDCEFAQKEFVFYHISKKLVEDQLSSYSLISQLNTEQLLNEVIERVSEHIDVYNRIRECYESSEASEDIGEQLHSLEVELLKNKRSG